MKQAVMLTTAGKPMLEKVYQPETLQALCAALRFLPDIVSGERLASLGGAYREARYIFSTWGMPALTESEWADAFPALEAVFYAAGSVQGFARPLLARNVRVYSAAMANGVPVAEFTVAQIILANKGYFQTLSRYRADGFRAANGFTQALPGNFGATVGILGAGAIGKLVIRMLSAYRLNILVFDPFLPDAEAKALGVRKVSLEDVFARSLVVSNHLANNAQTQGILRYAHFALMRPNGTFINTGRGAQVVEADLARALREEPGRTALLDVTDPEPVAADSPWFRLPNVHVTPHISGSAGHEVGRMGEFMLAAYRAHEAGQPFAGEVTEGMLATMA